jgi:hypothetical protein
MVFLYRKITLLRYLTSEAKVGRCVPELSREQTPFPILWPQYLLPLGFEDHCTAPRFVELSTGSCLYAWNTKLHVAGCNASPAKYTNGFGVQYHRFFLAEVALPRRPRFLRRLCTCIYQIGP